jgi:phenylacetic acid degradation protein PaaD
MRYMSDRPAGPAPAQDLARRSVAALYAADAASQRAGVSVQDVAPGRAVAAMMVRPDMVNGHGSCHGGYIVLLADSAFAFAANTSGVPTVAAGCDVEFLAPARLGDQLVAHAIERVRSRRGGVYDVTVRRGPDGDVVAEFRGRARTLPPRPW